MRMIPRNLSRRQWSLPVAVPAVLAARAARHLLVFPELPDYCGRSNSIYSVLSNA